MSENKKKEWLVSGSKNKKSRGYSKTYKSTEKLEKELAKYNRRIDQLKTIQIARQAELDLIRNDPNAWFASKAWGKNVNKQKEIDKRKEELAAKVTRLDILLMKAEGGKITQGMFDYTRGRLKKPGEKSLLEKFELVKPNGEAYVVGDDYIPTDEDRFTLIENIEDILDDREFAKELRNADNTPSPNFPQITIQDPNNKYKTIKIDKQDYLEGTDFRNEQQVIDNRLIEELKINQNQILNNSSKSDLTKSLTIESVQNFDKFGYK